MTYHWPLLPLTLLALALPVQAQILGTGVMPVVEVGPNLTQSTITATQSVITAVQSVISVENSFTELFPLETILVAEGLAEDMAALADIVAQVEGLSYDIQSLQAQIEALFGLDLAPNNATVLHARLAEIRRVRHQCYSYAMRVQTLINTAMRTFEHTIGLVNSIGAFVGAKQTGQTIAQQNATMSKTLTVLQVQTAAFQRAGSVDKMEELLVMESIRLINEDTRADWPKE